MGVAVCPHCHFVSAFLNTATHMSKSLFELSAVGYGESWPPRLVGQSSASSRPHVGWSVFPRASHVVFSDSVTVNLGDTEDEFRRPAVTVQMEKL